MSGKRKKPRKGKRTDRRAKRRAIESIRRTIHSASQPMARVTGIEADQVHIEYADENTIGAMSVGWGKMQPNSLPVTPTFEIEGPPVRQDDIFILLAGTIYLIEQDKGEVHGFDMQRHFDAHIRFPFSTRVEIRSEQMPLIADMAPLSERIAFCERASQWFAEQAIKLDKELQSQATKK